MAINFKSEYCPFKTSPSSMLHYTAVWGGGEIDHSSEKRIDQIGEHHSCTSNLEPNNLNLYKILRILAAYLPECVVAIIALPKNLYKK